MGKREGKKILAAVLALAVLCTTVLANPAPTLAASKTVTVKTQKELDAALKAGKRNILIKTGTNKKLTIKKGTYKNSTIKVDAPKATIVNSAKCKSIQIKNAKAVTENAKGNTYRILDKKLTLTVAKGAAVKQVKCDVAKGKLNLKVNGKVTKVLISKKTTVAITGKTSSKVKIEVGAKDSAVTTKVKADITLKKAAKITVKKGAEGTKVSIAKANMKFTIINESETPVEVKDASGAIKLVASGATVTETTINETKTTDASQTQTNTDTGKKDEGSSTTPTDKEEIKDENTYVSYEGYALQWEDNFEGTELNRDDWNVELHEPGWVNSELQEYVDSDQNIQVKDGSLYIKPVQTANEDGTYSYTSGRVNTQGKHDFTYGMFEVRAKVPTGRGYLPAFWMMPTDENIYGQWPRCGEIDCMEVMGQENNKLYGTIHFGNPHSESQGTYTLESGNFTDEYHTFTTEWEPGCIKWYVDGVLYHTENDWYSTTE